jgi:hypothetical protein
MTLGSFLGTSSAFGGLACFVGGGLLSVFFSGEASGVATGVEDADATGFFLSLSVIEEGGGGAVGTREMGGLALGSMIGKSLPVRSSQGDCNSSAVFDFLPPRRFLLAKVSSYGQ